MSESKKIKPNSIVVTGKVDGREIVVTANSFSTINWKVVTDVSGEAYYVKKAKSKGAK